MGGRGGPSPQTFWGAADTRLLEPQSQSQKLVCSTLMVLSPVFLEATSAELAHNRPVHNMAVSVEPNNAVSRHRSLVSSLANPLLVSVWAAAVPEVSRSVVWEAPEVCPPSAVLPVVAMACGVFGPHTVVQLPQNSPLQPMTPSRALCHGQDGGTSTTLVPVSMTGSSLGSALRSLAVVPGSTGFSLGSAAWTLALPAPLWSLAPPWSLALPAASWSSAPPAQLQLCLEHLTFCFVMGLALCLSPCSAPAPPPTCSAFWSVWKPLLGGYITSIRLSPLMLHLSHSLLNMDNVTLLSSYYLYLFSSMVFPVVTFLFIAYLWFWPQPVLWISDCGLPFNKVCLLISIFVQPVTALVKVKIYNPLICKTWKDGPSYYRKHLMGVLIN